LDMSIWDCKARGLPVETSDSLPQEEVRNAVD